MRNIFNKKEVFSIRKFSIGVASVMVTSSLFISSQVNSQLLKAQENIQVQVNKDISVNVIEKHGGAEVELIATKDVTNIDVNVMLDGNRVISYHIDSLKSGVSTKKYITKEQLDIIKKLISNGQKTLPNTAIVEKNISQSIVLSGYNLKVDVKYHVEEEPKAEQPKVEQPKVETPKVEQPKVETPKVEQPKVEQPKVEAPKVEQPKVETPKAEQPRVETPKVEQPKVETPKVEQPKVETPKVEQPKVETPKVEQPKVETPKVEQPKVETPKVEQPKVETPKVEQPKVETPKVEQPKVETPKVEQPKVETPKVEQPKVETPKVEQPKVETPKVEQPKVETPKVEQPKVETPKVEQPKVETPKVEQPKVETPKVEQPKVETPKVEQPKVEIPKVPQTIKRVEVRTETIVYKIEERNNEQLPQGTRKVVTAGKNGSYKVVRDDIYEGDKLVKQGTEQNIDRIEAVNEVVEIGTKVPQTIKRVEVRTETIAYKTEERNNDQLPQGIRKVVTAGKNGSYKVVRDDIYEGDKLVKQGTEQNIDRIEAVNEVVEIGTKVPQTTKRVNVRTETIKFKTETRYNNQLAQGTRNVLTAGKNGSYKVVRDDIYEGDKLVKQGAEQIVDRIEAINEVVEVGTKVPQTTKRVNVRTETIAYKTEERNNDQLPQGTRNVLTAGKNGSYKVVRDDIYEGDKLVKQGTEQNVDRIEAVNEVVEIGTKVPQATTDTYFVLDTENNWFVTSEQTDALTKLFGTANGNVDVTSVVEKLKDPENYKLFNKLNLGQYFNKVNNPASVQKMINDYALKNQLEINKKFIDLANVERVKAGLVPAVSAFENTFMNKKVDSFVQDMVNERAKEMADYGSSRYLGKKEGKHKRPDGRSWYTVYSDKGIDLTGTSDDNHRYNMAGENAGQGNWGDLYFLTTPDEIIKDMFYGWMSSPGHRALILNDVPHPIFAFSYRQGLKDYLGSKYKPTVAMLHVTSWFNPLDYPVSKKEYEKWKEDPKNKDNVFASDEYYNFLKANTKNKATQ